MIRVTPIAIHPDLLYPLYMEEPETIAHNVIPQPVEIVLAVPIIDGRGKNPNSRMNLRPYEPGHAPTNGIHSGPMVTPALRRLAALQPSEVETLMEAGGLNSAEMVAAKLILAVLEGSDRGSKARDQLMNRLDGEPEKSTPAIAVQVNLTWNDGESA